MKKNGMVVLITLLIAIITSVPLAANYLDSGYTTSMAIYLNTTNTGSNVTANVTNFPVLVRLTGANFDFSKNLVANGGDIRFTDDAGTVLSFEIERWKDGAGSNDSAEIWVKVPTVYGNLSTHYITMYCGKTGATALSNGSNVFQTTNGYQTVWHFPSADTFHEATSNNWDLVNNGTQDSIGVIGRGRLFNGTNAWINAGINRGYYQNTGALSVSSWLKVASLDSGMSTFPASINNGGLPTTLSRIFVTITKQTGDVTFNCRADDVNPLGIATTNPMPVGSWVYLVGVVDVANDSMALYKNGVLWASGSVPFVPASTPNTASACASLGSEDNGVGSFFNGVMDEVVTAKTLRSSDWIKLCYENQKSSQTLLTYGSIQPAISTSSSIILHQFAGTTSQPPDTIEIWNSGWFTLNWSATHTLTNAYVSVDPTPSSSTGPTDRKKVIITYSTSNLAAATYLDTIRFTSTNASNSSYNIPITLIVTNPLQVTTDKSSFVHSLTGAGIVPAETFNLWNANSGGTLACTLSTKGSSSWLSVLPLLATSTGPTQQASISVQYSSLNGGIWRDTILIKAGNAINSGMKIPVTITVTAPVISTDKAALSRNIVTGENATSDVIRLRNSGTGTLSYSLNIVNQSTWLSVSPSSGSLTTDTASLTVSYAMSNSPSYTSGGIVSDTITITGTGTSNSPVKIPVTVTVTPRPTIAFVRATISGVVNVPIVPDTIINTGGIADSFIITSSTLPTGLSFDKFKGILSGKPIEPFANTTYLVTGYNRAGTGTASVGITIAAAPDVDGPAISPNIQFTATAIGPTQINLTWRTPESNASDADSVVVYMSTTHVPTGNSDASAQRVGGVKVLKTTSTQTMSLLNFTAQKKYYFSLQLKDVTGNYSPTYVVDSATTSALNALVNPIVISGQYYDSTRVKLTVSNFKTISTTPPDPSPFADKIGIWYNEIRYDTTRNLNAPKVLLLSLASLKTRAGTASSVDTIVTIQKIPSGYERYYFTSSVHYNSPDSIPRIVLPTNGCEVLMRDTARVRTLVSVSGTYQGGDSALVTIANPGAIDPVKVDSILIWSGLLSIPYFADPIASTRLKATTVLSELVGGAYSYKIRSAQLAGYKHTMYLGVTSIGTNRLWGADTVMSSFQSGYDAPPNNITLSATSLVGSRVHLEWNSQQDSVRILYRTSSAIPVGQNLGQDLSVYTVLNPPKTCVDTVLLLNPLTTYYFGLQVYSPATRLWSLVSNQSSQSVKTISIDSTQIVPNRLKLTGLSFNDTTNNIVVQWRMNTQGTTLADSVLCLGIQYGFDNYAEHKDSVSTSGVTIKLTKGQTQGSDTVYPGNRLMFESVCHVSLYLKSEFGGWSAPTDSSRDSINIGVGKWQLVSYFPTDTVWAFNSKIVLWKDAEYTSELEVVVDTMRRFVSSYSNGFTQEYGIFFSKQPLIPFNIGFRYDLIDSTIDEKDIWLYRDSSGVLSAIHTAKIDREKNLIWVKTNDLRYPLVVVRDTVHPTVVFIPGIDTAASVLPNSLIPNQFNLSDNIRNVQCRMYAGKGDNELTLVRDTTLSSGTGLLSMSIDPQYVTSDNGVRIYIVTDDGAHVDTIDISRQVNRSENRISTSENKEWTPIYTTSILDNNEIRNALGELGGPIDVWTYNNIKFRVFRWYDPAGNGSDNNWQELAIGQNDTGFNLIPGKLIWIKTRLGSDLNFGSGKTVSLKRPYEINLAANAFTDFALPFKFKIVLGDILTASGISADSLQVYAWKKTDGKFSSDPLYFNNVTGKNDRTIELLFSSTSGEGGFTIFNPTSHAITLKIPATPSILSTFAKALAKKSSGSNWSICITGVLDNGSHVNPVYCGYSPSSKTDFLPSPPSLVLGGIKVLDAKNNKLYGHCINGAVSELGYVYELVLYNRDLDRQTINYTLSSAGTLPQGMEAWIYNPGTRQLEQTDNLFASIEPDGREYRYLVVGKRENVSKMVSSRNLAATPQLSIHGNMLMRHRVMLGYTVPYTGIGALEFSVYDLTGRLIWQRRMDGGSMHPGVYEMSWNGENSSGRRISNGAYIVKLQVYDKGTRKNVAASQRVMFVQ